MNIVTPIDLAEPRWRHAATPDSGFVETIAGGGCQVRRVPIAVEGCFGWLHTPCSGPALDTAVLICPAVVRDALQSHHAMRLLANACAEAGYPTMRFDYPGTGDSDDLAAGAEFCAAEPWAAWRRSTHAAADWLCRTQSVRRVVLLGLRLGATLATLVAQERADSAGLILLAPVLRGQSYIKQLRIQAQLELRGTEPDPAPLAETAGRGGLEFHELSFSADTVAAIAAIDLASVGLPAGLPVAIVPQAASSLVTRCAAAWREGGVAVDCVGYDGLEPLLRVDTLVDHPPPDFGRVIDWLRTAVPGGRGAGPVLAPAGAVLRPGGCIETAVRFGAGQGLFGILCRPDTATAHAGTAVLIVNTGRDPHYGVGRFGVYFARHLARAGVASLRMDFAGLGDSAGLPDDECRHSSLFADAREADIAAALDLLQEEGFDRIAVQGLCSGGYHAFHAAVADARIGCLMLVNLPLFSWRPGDDAQFIAHKLTPTHRYAAALFRRGDWRRLLSGQVQFGRLLRAQCERLVERLQRGAVGRLFGQHNWLGPHAAARRGIAALARRHVRTLLLFAPNDPGLDTIHAIFGPDAAALRGTGADMQIVPGINHELSATWMRAEMAERMLRFVSAQASFTPARDPGADTMTERRA